MGVFRGIFSASLILFFLVFIPLAANAAINEEDVETSINVGVLLILGTLIAAFTLAKHVSEHPWKQFSAILQIIAWGAYLVYSTYDLWVKAMLTEDISIKITLDLTTYIILVLIGLGLALFINIAEIFTERESKLSKAKAV